MTKPIVRRGFVKQGVALGGAFLLRPALAAADEQKPAPDSSGASNETLATLHALRSTHGNFSERQIPDEHLEQILQASVRAANSSNMQTYSIIVIADRDKMKAVCGYAGSRLLIYCVDYNRIKATAESLGHRYHADNMTNYVTGATNAAVAAQTAVIAARALGIDSLLTNGIHRGDMARLWRLLDLPQQHCFPQIALVLGYATSPPAHKTGRLDGVGIVHHETYHRLTEAEAAALVARYDDPESHLGLNDSWSQEGHKHYLDWLHTKWLRGSDSPTTQDTHVFSVLKTAGFVEPHNP